MIKTFKRYCKTLELVDDSQLIKEYKKRHAMGEAWPQVTEGMKSVGILDMEIYINGTTLFMIMDTKVDFDHDAAMETLAGLPGQAEWEAYMSDFQKTVKGSSAKEKWKLMERIYKMDQDAEYKAADGQVEIFNI